jgi:hypothetical protein
LESALSLRSVPGTVNAVKCMKALSSKINPRAGGTRKMKALSAQIIVVA